MIRHIVLMRFRPEISEPQIAAVLADLHAIKSRLPGMLAVSSGRSASPEQIERGYMHGFIADFADWQALQAYQTHPDHQKAGAALVALTEGGLEGIVVLDIDVTGQI